MVLFGITGGIGMGKSTAGNFLLGWGYPIIDTDILARQIVAPHQPALREIQSAFGDIVIGNSGELNREQLAKLVFADPSARQKLESILHPRIRRMWQDEVKVWRGSGQRVGFVTIPLLYETAAADLFDAVICIACSEETQLQRLRNRGWDDTDIRQRKAAQWAVEKKMALSDYVVWSDTSIEMHGAQLLRILNQAV